MKRFSSAQYFLFIALFPLAINTTQAQSIGINSDGSAPHTSAMLDVKSTTKGMLVPRMLSSERTAISSPAVGLMVFDTQTNSFWFYKSSGWTELTGGTGGTSYWNTTGSDIYNNNSGKVFIGTNTGAGALTVKTPPTGATSLLLGESGDLFSDNLSVSISPGGGTSSTRSGFLLGSFGNTTYGFTISNTRPAPLCFSTNAIEKMRITFDGNVGINTISPSTKLEIATDINQWGATQNNGTVSVGTYISQYEGWLATKTPHPLYFRAGLLTSGQTPQMALLTNGNLGIGTGNPTVKLEVLTNDAEYGFIQSNGPVRMGTYVGYNGGWLGTQSNHPLYFFTNNGNAVMTVATNGNVGIGTITPTYKLSVNGTIQTKEVRVQTGWADYVFEEGYQLKPLPDVERFILANKHLSGIPSAKEIESNGLALGDIQTKMMQKIEELTLYVIQANKTIEELKQRIELIEKANR